MNLAEITMRYQQLMENAEQTPEDAFRDTQEVVSGEFDEAAIERAEMISLAKAERDVYKARKQFYERKENLRTRFIDLNREFLRDSIIIAKKYKIQSPEYTITICKGKKKLVYNEKEVIDWCEKNGYDNLVDYTSEVNEDQLTVFLEEHPDMDIPVRIEQKESVRIR